MGLNLLSLARSSAAGLHNSGRGGGKSYSPGSKHGNKIAGTNIKQGAGLTNLASKGRGGDTKIRKVAGRPSHVNTTEAKAIDSFGPLGEAWVQRIGSGTINPKTGLKEFKPFFKRKWARKIGKFAKGKTSLFKGGSWNPSKGKWGIFGQTGASRARDVLKNQAKARSDAFDTYRRGYEDENIAAIMTENPDDNTEQVKDYSGNQGLIDFITNDSGLNNPGGFVTTNDIEDYTDYYDERKEDELKDQYNRDIETLEGEETLLNKTFQTTSQNNGSTNSANLFGLLTQSQTVDSNQNFAGTGSFADDFKNKTLIETAERENNAGQTQVEVDRDRIDAGFEELDANLVTNIQNEHDAYNQEFWNNMTTWESKINA